MKNKLYFGVSIRIILLFSIGFMGTFVPEYFDEFFKDVLVVGEKSCATCAVEPPHYEWSARYMWWFYMCLTFESVFEKLGGDLDDDDDDRINELESDVENLEKEISMYQKILGNTMIDSWKMEIYVENKDKFTPLQLQQIFQASIASGMNEKTH
jgi:hypothetical protein